MAFKNFFHRLRFAWNAPDGRDQARVVAAGMVVPPVLYGFSLVPGNVALGVSLLAAAMLSWMLHAGMGAEYERQMRELMKAKSGKWIDSGEDADEIRRRRDRVRSIGAAAALAEADIFPTLEPLQQNVDGTPMVPGLGVDQQGHVLGYYAVDALTPLDNATGVGLDVTSAYQAPIGLDSSSAGSSITPHSFSSDN